LPNARIICATHLISLFDEQIDLAGGYYDAGNNVKFGFPMAFTISMLSWSVVEFKDKLQSKNELSNALAAIRWGTDYLIKAHPLPDVLYGEVGDGDSDHSCWQRPEDMTTPRTVYKIDDQHPGADLAGETAAAFAAASVAFAPTDSNYSAQLLTHAEQVFFSVSSSHNQFPRIMQAVACKPIVYWLTLFYSQFVDSNIKCIDCYTFFN